MFFGLSLGKVWQVCSNNPSQSDGVNSAMASVAAEPFQVLHMDPMSDVLKCNQLLVVHLCHLMHYFGLSLGKFGGYAANPSQSDGVNSAMASVAAEPFLVLHMDPMSDVLMCNQLLVAHLCHLMPCFVL
jgi:hypothetical protein